MSHALCKAMAQPFHGQCKPASSKRILLQKLSQPAGEITCMTAPVLLNGSSEPYNVGYWPCMTEARSHGGAAPWFYLPISLKPAQQLVLPFLPEQLGHLVVEQRIMTAQLKDCSLVMEVLLLSWVLVLISPTELAAGVFWKDLDKTGCALD